MMWLKIAQKSTAGVEKLDKSNEMRPNQGGSPLDNRLTLGYIQNEMRLEASNRFLGENWKMTPDF